MRHCVSASIFGLELHSAHNIGMKSQINEQSLKVQVYLNTNISVLFYVKGGAFSVTFKYIDNQCEYEYLFDMMF